MSNNNLLKEYFYPIIIVLFIWACPTPPAGGSGQTITSIF